MGDTMKQYSAQVLIALATLLLLTTGGAVALAQDSGTVTITNPTEGETVSGVVEVVGTVIFPDFLKYEVFLKTGDSMIWGATAYATVDNGVLARLDTRTVPDGMYQLVVRTVHPNSNYEEVAGPTFTVENNLDAPLPAEVQPSPLYVPTSGDALARIQNCSGVTLEFDYVGTVGGCSADNLWIMAKMQDENLCETVDVLLIPCEYRGTAQGLGFDGVTYSFEAVGGKVYEITYPGEAKLFINEVPPEDAAPGGISQPEAGDQAAPTRAPAASDSVLPISGRAAAPSNIPFIAVAGGLIALMVVGGVVAMRRGKQEES